MTQSRPLLYPVPVPVFIKENKPFIIAEIGGNHEGDFNYAKRLLVEAAATGVDAVKFQTYTADKIVSLVEGFERNQHFKKFELTNDEFIELATLAKHHGLLFMSSIWDRDALKILDPYIAIHKVGSGDLTNFPLLADLAKTGKPLILSVAMATINDVKETVSFLKQINPELILERKLVITQCVAMYGDSKAEYANLLAIRYLQDIFPDIHIGYSDHTKGTYACELALGMGCLVIEKHFTDNKTREFRDHHLSADVTEMTSLVGKSEHIYKLLGEYGKQPVTEIETAARIKEFRRAVYLNTDLLAGTQLSEEHLITLRPNVGIDARDYYKVIGKTLKQDHQAYTKLEWDLLKP